MKKFVIILALLLLISITVGCTQNKEASSKMIEIKIDSLDKEMGNVYSKMYLRVSEDAFLNETEITIVSLPATKYDDWHIGGSYFVSPQDAELKVPAFLSLEYTDAAIDIHKIKYPDFNESDLTIAYWDPIMYKYVRINSTLDVKSKTLSGNIQKFYKGGIVIIEKKYSIVSK